MAKPVTDYQITVKVKGDERHPTATEMARIIRNKLYADGLTATVTSKIVVKEDA